MSKGRVFSYKWTYSVFIISYIELMLEQGILYFNVSTIYWKNSNMIEIIANRLEIDRKSKKVKYLSLFIIITPSPFLIFHPYPLVF